MTNDESYHQGFLSEFSETIKQSEFGKIFSNFKQVIQQHKIVDGYQDLYLIGYENNKCKLGFFNRKGDVFFVAIAFSETGLWDQYEWIGLEYLIAYLKKEPIVVEFEKPFEKRNNIKNRLNELYKNFQPFSKQIFSLFQDEKQVSNLRLLLGEYLKEDTRRRYNLK